MNGLLVNAFLAKHRQEVVNQMLIAMSTVGFQPATSTHVLRDKQAILQEANLYQAYLCEANLEGANLREAFLQQANLEKANLSVANLREAFLPDYVDKRVDKRKGGLVKICEVLLKDIRLTG